MNEETKHWDSKVMFILGDGVEDLQKRINRFCEGKFVVGIQYPEHFAEEGNLAVVSYKVKQK